MDSKKVTTILIDCDGVLTDGKVWYDSRGGRMKGFHSRDIRAIRQLVSHGYELVILTQSSWPGINDFAKRTGAEVKITRDKNPDAYGSYYAIGDDTPDIEMLSKAVLAFCPKDADSSVISMPNVRVLYCKGGEGVVAEFVNELSK